MGDRKVTVKNVDMSEDMQNVATRCGEKATADYSIEKDIAAYIKKEFDKQYHPTWHCIVGKSFGR